MSLFVFFKSSREQLAIAEFANALLVIPKTLAVNAAKDSTELVAKLRAYHNASQSAPAGDPKRGLKYYGLDLHKGEVRDNIKAGVMEPMISKVKSFKSALEAATSLLRIDDRVSFTSSLMRVREWLGVGDMRELGFEGSHFSVVLNLS